jgi:hypothetical protein
VLSKSLGVCNSVGTSSYDVLGVLKKKLVIADAIVSWLVACKHREVFSYKKVEILSLEFEAGGARRASKTG